jgi:hypothetical protein
MWLADRVTCERGADGQIEHLIARISGDQNKLEIMLDKVMPTFSEARRLNFSQLGSLAFTAYAEVFPVDRLKLARIAVARALEFEAQPVPAGRLVERAQAIWTNHNWQWSLFCEEKIDSYLKDERALEDRVASTIDSFDSRTSEMIKAVSDTALASVAALIGSILASAFSESFKETIFRLSMYGYAAYVAIFPGLLGMLHFGLRYRIIGDGYRTESLRIAENIGQDRVSAIVGGRINSTKCRFWSYFGVSIVAYLGICVVALLAANYVPAMMGKVSTRVSGGQDSKGSAAAPTSSPAPAKGGEPNATGQPSPKKSGASPTDAAGKKSAG